MHADVLCMYVCIHVHKPMYVRSVDYDVTYVSHISVPAAVAQ